MSKVFLWPEWADQDEFDDPNYEHAGIGVVSRHQLHKKRMAAEFAAEWDCYYAPPKVAPLAERVSSERQQRECDKRARLLAEIAQIKFNG